MGSVIPENVNIMALTATATVSTRREIIKILDMQKPVIVSIPPIKDNIFFCATPRGSLSLSLSPISDILEKWFPLRGERAHSLKLFCMYDKRFEISKTK